MCDDAHDPAPVEESEYLSRFEMPPTARNKLILEQTVEHRICRVCAAPLVPVLDLGKMFVSDFPRQLTDRGPKVLLELAMCNSPACSLVQLTRTVPRDALYRTRYWYRSGVNESMRAELADVATWVLERIGVLTPRDVVLDIGANDGTLLSALHYLFESERYTPPPRLWACEPSPTFHHELLEGPVEHLIPDYFPWIPWKRSEPGTYVPNAFFKLIFSIAMVYDLEDPNAFVREIARVLHPEGLWIVQMGDLASMLASAGFDTICHEHLELYSLRSFMSLMARHGLEVVDAVRSRVNGGSLRLAVAHRSDLGAWSQEGADAVDELLRDETEVLSDDPTPLHVLRGFHDVIRNRMTAVQQYLLLHTTPDDPCELLGASTKANTLLQHLNLGPELCRRAIERSLEKAGRLTVTGIPIVDEAAGRVQPAPLRLVGPWHFRAGLVEREREYLRNRGRLLFPLPVPCVVWMQDGELKEREL